MGASITTSRGRRLLCIYQHAPTRGAGGFYRHRRYLAELVRRGWHVDLVSTPVHYMTGMIPPEYAGRPYTREILDGIEHHWVWAPENIHTSRSRRAANYLAFATGAALRSLTLSRPDLIWASSPPLPIGTVGETLSWRFRRPWVFEIRDLWPESAVSVGWLTEDSRLYRILDRCARRYAERANLTIVPTPGLVEAAREHGARRVELIPGAVIDASCDESTRRRVRQQLGITNAECVVMYVGALGIANGLDTLLDAAKLLPPGAPLEVFLVGGGSDRDRIAARVEAEKIDRIRMVGVVPKARVPELLAASDVCLHLLRPDPLFAGALPTKVLEYFGAHRPFITTVPGVPEQLARDSGNGFAGTPAALCQELLRFAAMPEADRLQLGNRSFEYGAAKFGFEPVVDRLEAVLLKAMEMGFRSPFAAQQAPTRP